MNPELSASPRKMKRLRARQRTKDRGEPRPSTLGARMQTGACVGTALGIAAVVLLASEYADLARQGAFFPFFACAGAAAGGALAGALMGPAQRFTRRPAEAAAAGAVLAVVSAAVPLLATWRFFDPGALAVAAYFGIAVVVGALAGLLVRDVAQFGAPDKKPRLLRRPPLWVLVLVELGWIFEALPSPRNRRRRRLRNEPVPEEWSGIIRRNVPLFSRITEEDQRALLGHVNVFLAEKRFEGCGGLAITDEIRVTIAAQACLLLLHTPHAWFPTLRTVLVYPEAYVARERERGGGVDHERPSVRLGESWLRGQVVLSWRSVAAGAENPDDGQNVVLHEFAHQLDQADGASDGIPEMRRFGAYHAWASVLAHRFGAFQRKAEKGRRDVMDAYGAKNRAEFFAVATETFFEKPLALQRKDPGLYDALRDYYGLDPAAAVRAPEAQKAEA